MEVLNHGDVPFDLSFPPVRGVHPCLTLKAAAAHVCEDQDGVLSNFLVDRKTFGTQMQATRNLSKT